MSESLNYGTLDDWREERGIGSASYFGDCLRYIRRGNRVGFEQWASEAGLAVEDYKMLEGGKYSPRPEVGTVNEWFAGWQFDRDTIIDLKVAGGYDISAYLTEPMNVASVAGGLKGLLDEQPMAVKVLSVIVRMLR